MGAKNAKACKFQFDLLIIASGRGRSAPVPVVTDACNCSASPALLVLSQVQRVVQGVVVVFRVVVGQRVAADDQLQPVASLGDERDGQAAVKVPGPDVVHLHTTQGRNETGQDGSRTGSEVSNGSFRFVCLLIPAVLKFHDPTLLNDRWTVDSRAQLKMAGRFLLWSAATNG